MAYSFLLFYPLCLPSPLLLFPSGLHTMEREWTESGLRKSMNWRFIEVICFLFIWDHITVRSSRPDPSATEQHVTKQYDWLISDRGPFHHSRSYLSFVERFRQGFTTRYKIYRWVHLFSFLKTLVPTCRHQQESVHFNGLFFLLSASSFCEDWVPKKAVLCALFCLFFSFSRMCFTLYLFVCKFDSSLVQYCKTTPTVPTDRFDQLSLHERKKKFYFPKADIYHWSLLASGWTRTPNWTCNLYWRR